MTLAKLISASLLALCCTVAATFANTLPTPEGRVILIVTGDIAASNTSGTAEFDRAMLAELGTRTIETNTIWTEGIQTFTGVPLSSVVERLGATGFSLRAVAVNDYSIEIPLDHVKEDSALLAFERNGEIMSLREKGPIWLVYPYDSDRRFQTEVYHSRSVWQLREIVVRR